MITHFKYSSFKPALNYLLLMEFAFVFQCLEKKWNSITRISGKT